MKKVEKKSWTEYLNEYVGCPQDPVTQNRPCDFGCICDRCVKSYLKLNCI